MAAPAQTSQADPSPTQGNALQRRSRRQVLMIALLVNTGLFIIECIAGLLAGSTALLGDALDMFADAFIYGVSLYALARGPEWVLRAAVLKGWLMLVFGVAVLGQAAYRLSQPALPEPAIMAGVAMLALAGNAVCLWLLTQYRGDDLNMRSVWLCSRNDLIANLAVLAAAGAVWRLQSPWPDVLVGAGIATLFIHCALGILREARRRPGWEAEAAVVID